MAIEDDITKEYQDKLGRDPTADELASDKANADKYGWNSGPNGGVQATIDNRATNTPNSGGPDSNAPPAQQWNQSSSLFPDWYGQLMQRNLDQQAQAEAENKARSDALYSTLNDRASQSLAVSPTDPTIKAQTDAYRAEQTRNSRDYLSGLAESAGPNANLRGEQRIAAEKVGQGTAGFQAQLMGQELQARRDEIAQAIASEGSMLSGDQTRALQAQLANMDQAIAEANAKTNATSVANQFTLGQGQLALGKSSLDTSNDQFLRELALRAWQAQDQSQQGWATL